MKLPILFTGAIVALTGLAAPQFAIASDAALLPQGLHIGGAPFTFDNDTSDEFARKGRRARVPGGSGCDSPRDLREHPECRA
jgi:hypothetical protein